MLAATTLIKLQGINVLPGSFVTGQIRWAIIGVIGFGAGIAWLLAANRRGLTGKGWARTDFITPGA